MMIELDGLERVEPESVAVHHVIRQCSLIRLPQHDLETCERVSNFGTEFEREIVELLSKYWKPVVARGCVRRKP